MTSSFSPLFPIIPLIPHFVELPLSRWQFSSRSRKWGNEESEPEMRSKMRRSCHDFLGVFEK